MVHIQRLLVLLLTTNGGIAGVAVPNASSDDDPVVAGYLPLVPARESSAGTELLTLFLGTVKQTYLGPHG